MTQDFKKDLAYGQQFEEIFLKELKALGRKPVIVNKKGHDIKDEQYTYEVKADTYTENNGNIAIELISNKTIGSPGWIYYTDADWLIYFVSKKTFYMFKMLDLKIFVDNTKTLFEEKNTIHSQAVNLIIPLVKVPKSIYKKRVIKKCEVKNQN